MVDTRDTAEAVDAGDVRPVVRLATRPNRTFWLFGAGLAGLGAILFTSLEARRSGLEPVDHLVAEPSTGRIASPPELAIPHSYRTDQLAPAPVIVSPQPVPSTALAQTAGRPVRTAENRPARPLPFQPAPLPYISPLQQPVYSPPPPIAPQYGPAQNASARQDRVSAYQFSNPGTTVPKGTIIQAVMETALDSTRAGFSRAIVSRDVRSFDGQRILIPRGSRLIGDYGSEMAPGQNRLLIQWQRLTRPDGVVIDLASPSSDPLGRAGVKGKVDSHFAERLGGAILQTLLTIGPQIGLSKLTRGDVVYAVPLGTQLAPAAGSERVQRTLKLKQGSSVSVFVAKDLDFTSFER